MRTRVVLCGTGHAHLLVLEHFARTPDPDMELHLVSQGQEQVYSSRVSGFLAGALSREQTLLPLTGLARAAGATLHPQGAHRVCTRERWLELEDGSRLDYDFASLNVGAGLRREGLSEPHTRVQTLRPIANALALRMDLAREGVLVVGGGAAGVELAFCLRARTDAPTVLVTSSERVPAGSSAREDACVRRILGRKGIEVIRGRVSQLHADAAELTSGVRMRYGLALWATGAAPPSLLSRTDAALSDAGFLAVHPTLQSTSAPTLFGAGDCVDFVSGRAPGKSGVYSVREGPVLARNLRAVVHGRKLQPYRPQRQALYILDVGDGTGIALGHGVPWHGRRALALKRRLDVTFIKRLSRHGDGHGLGRVG